MNSFSRKHKRYLGLAGKTGGDFAPRETLAQRRTCLTGVGTMTRNARSEQFVGLKSESRSPGTRLHGHRPARGPLANAVVRRADEWVPVQAWNTVSATTVIPGRAQRNPGTHWPSDIYRHPPMDPRPRRRSAKDDTDRSSSDHPSGSWGMRGKGLCLQEKSTPTCPQDDNETQAKDGVRRGFPSGIGVNRTHRGEKQIKTAPCGQKHRVGLPAPASRPQAGRDRAPAGKRHGARNARQGTAAPVRAEARARDEDKP